MQSNVGVIVGSLRKDAYTRMLSRALPELAPASLRLADIAIGDLPLYNADLETADPPAAWTTFRKQVMACDAILFVTPEFNRSMPGALKNALDVGSRPWGRSAWDGKPAGVVSLSPGALGAMAANHHLRQVLLAVNLAAMPYPEAYIPDAATLFDEQGRLSSAETRGFLAGFMKAFETWVGKVRAA
ncbi:MAG: NADPH-dependent FMN reductase [Steroidobacteraceae bacterium]